MTDHKIVKLYIKDKDFSFTGKLIHIDENFCQIIDHKTNTEMTIPILNVSRIEEIKEAKF